MAAGRGVARCTRSLLGALAAAFPGDEWLALVPARGAVRSPRGVPPRPPPAPGPGAVRAATLAGRPRLDRVLDGVDVVWAPAPAPLALSAGVPLVLTVHDRSFEERPGDFTPYERLWHRLARPRTLAARAAAVVCDTEAGGVAVVAPSWLEGFGLPPVEAAALGTPSVVSDLPVFAETVGDGALRVPPGDPAALADALIRIVADADLRERLGAAAGAAAARYD